MAEIQEKLPDFTNPPVVEVALSIQFDPIENLRTPQIGLLWNQFKNDFPLTEEHSPLDPTFERFGIPPNPKGPPVQLRMLEALPPPRCWFLNRGGTELIQVQTDRFIHNWRKKEGDQDYPRYEKLREALRTELDIFQSFIDRENLGTLSPNQCEVTYVNHIPLPEGMNHGHLNEVLAPVTLQYTDTFLSETEEAKVALHYVIKNDEGKPIGRLHVESIPAYRISDGLPMYILTLTARGAPADSSIDKALRFLDIGRDWVVRGFAAVTTAKMQKAWGRNL